MSEWVRAGLDIILIGVVIAGLIQVSRLIRHLAGLRQGRIDMERFVREFSATVVRAEAGVKGLRQAARDSGDDLEKLVERANLIRDELQLIIPSADQIAERLSQAAGNASKFMPTHTFASDAKTEAKPASETPKPAPAFTTTSKTPDTSAAPTSRAEKELLQALQKLS